MLSHEEVWGDLFIVTIIDIVNISDKWASGLSDSSNYGALMHWF